eukprot:5943414-Amphidinium_carterae.4
MLRPSSELMLSRSETDLLILGDFTGGALSCVTEQGSVKITERHKWHRFRSDLSHKVASCEGDRWSISLYVPRGAQRLSMHSLSELEGLGFSAQEWLKSKDKHCLESFLVCPAEVSNVVSDLQHASGGDCVDFPITTEISAVGSEEEPLPTIREEPMEEDPNPNMELRESCHHRGLAQCGIQFCMDEVLKFGIPEAIVSDLGPEFAGGWQGRTERLGSELKSQIRLVLAECEVFNLSDLQAFVYACDSVAARNRHVDRSGYSSEHRVFGMTRRFPNELLQDDRLDNDNALIALAKQDSATRLARASAAQTRQSVPLVIGLNHWRLVENEEWKTKQSQPLATSGTPPQTVSSSGEVRWQDIPSQDHALFHAAIRKEVDSMLFKAMSVLSVEE